MYIHPIYSTFTGNAKLYWMLPIAAGAQWCGCLVPEVSLARDLYCDRHLSSQKKVPNGGCGLLAVVGYV